jgi:acetyl-CoA acetyltransferase
MKRRPVTFPSNTAAIVGVGYSPLSRNSGVTVDSLALQACWNAIRDAGMTPHDIDGLECYYTMDSTSALQVAEGLGIEDVRWLVEYYDGGPTATLMVASAAMAINAGLCNTVILWRAMNGRSGVRPGQWGADNSQFQSTELQFEHPYGLASPPQMIAMLARRHMHNFGTTQEHLGAVAITERQHAIPNERAIMRAPITMEEYLNSRWIVEPFHLLDCCPETDGACAVVVTSRERAEDCPHKPVYATGFAYGAVPKPSWQHWTGDYPDTHCKYIASRVWASAGLGPDDTDFANFYDPFTISVIIALEEYGFCKTGEGGPFVAEGHAAIGGRLPVNSHGGLLSEAYLQGLNHACEAVIQLRGEAGERQIPNAHVGLWTSGSGPVGGGMVLTN